MKETIYITIFLICVFSLGWCSNTIYSLYVNDQEKEKFLDGVRFVYNSSDMEAIKYAQTLDEYGDWVCSNVKGFTYDRCVEVAQHECAHEIFAEVCETNTELCHKTEELLNNYGANLQPKTKEGEK